ncbi:MAG TPA: DNA topoisomerase IB, partial [Actinomycetota bacterium]|nr:DNA topoisomerase IB [Actinomycetota bacterium]
MGEPAALIPAPSECAKVAGLRYVTDASAGITRKRAGKGFAYRDPGAAPVKDPETLARIRSLAIPPAWTEVWICPSPNGHIQATGRDARGRKQYRYHAHWREVRDEAKYTKMIDFGTSLPTIRRRTAKDLAKPGLPREKVLATVVGLLDQTLIRIGNPEYARDNDSYGLTTLRDKHARVSGDRLIFCFRGKHGKKRTVELQDRRLARVVKSCRDIPGQELFQYVDDDGASHVVESSDVNDYLRGVTSMDFTAKDFRTWAGSVLAAEAFVGIGPPSSDTEAKRNVVRAVETVSEQLGNTPAVCRKCYMHPEVIDAYTDGSLIELWDTLSKGHRSSPYGLRPEEAAVLALLKRRAA